MYTLAHHMCSPKWGWAIALSLDRFLTSELTDHEQETGSTSSNSCILRVWPQLSQFQDVDPASISEQL